MKRLSADEMKSVVGGTPTFDCYVDTFNCEVCCDFGSGPVCHYNPYVCF